MDVQTFILYAISGFAVGGLVGLTGVGGGSLMTPILTLFFGIEAKVAVGTDLAFAAITKTGGTLMHRVRGSVDWRIVKLLCIGSLPAAVLTYLVLLNFHLKPGKALGSQLDSIIRWTMAGCVLLTVTALLFRKKMLAWMQTHPSRQIEGRKREVITVIAGSVIGSLVMLTSIGAGAIGATVLALLYPKHPASKIAGTDIAYAVPLTALCAVLHWGLGGINWVLLAALLVGSLPGITLGSYASKIVPEVWLRTILASILTIVASQLILKDFKSSDNKPIKATKTVPVANHQQNPTIITLL